MSYQPDESGLAETGALVALLLAALGLVVLVYILMPTAAGASDVCLSKREARHLWPRQHIYWYSSDRCWSNRRGPPQHLEIEKEPEEPKKKIRTDPIFPPKADALPAPRTEAPLQSNKPMNIVEDGCCWPVLTEFDLRFAGVPDGNR